MLATDRSELVETVTLSISNVFAMQTSDSAAVSRSKGIREDIEITDQRHSQAYPRQMLRAEGFSAIALFDNKQVAVVLLPKYFPKTIKPLK